LTEPVACLRPFSAIGGLGFSPDEHLIRFIGHPDELRSILHGRLSLTQALGFSDRLEAARTEADRRWTEQFFGQSSGYRSAQQQTRREAMLATAYVSCWHRLTLTSDIERLADEYLTSGFKCVVRTTVMRIRQSLPPPDGTPYYLDVFPVTYIDDESRRLEDVLDGQYPFCAYPELQFKRKATFGHEQETRFVMHDWSAVMSFPGPGNMLLREHPKRRYQRIEPAIFVAAVYALNAYTGEEAKAILDDSGTAVRLVPTDIADLPTVLFHDISTDSGCRPNQ
jgi:hypothetical protein